MPRAIRELDGEKLIGYISEDRWGIVGRSKGRSRLVVLATRDSFKDAKQFASRLTAYDEVYIVDGSDGSYDQAL